jgi:hypothetical protein
MLKRLASVARMSMARKTFAAEAVILLCLARLAISVLPFAKLMRWFGATALDDGQNKLPELDPAQTRIALGVRHMIARAVRFIPFDITCLPQAMAGSAMLTRRSVPARISLGLPKTGGLPAHAWLEAGKIPITGMAGADAYTPIARFVGAGAKGRRLASLHQGRD